MQVLTAARKMLAAARKGLRAETKVLRLARNELTAMRRVLTAAIKELKYIEMISIRLSPPNRTSVQIILVPFFSFSLRRSEFAYYKRPRQSLR